MIKKQRKQIQWLLAITLLGLLLTGCGTGIRESTEQKTPKSGALLSENPSGEKLSTSSDVWDAALSAVGYDMVSDPNGTESAQAFIVSFLDTGTDYISAL